MYSYVTQSGLGVFLTQETIPLILSLLIVEVFLKLHSFTLEALSFLAIWYLISGAMNLLSRKK